MDGQVTADNIQDYLKVLSDHQACCEREGKFVEAEMASKRLAELKYQDYQRQRNELLFNQTQ